MSLSLLPGTRSASQCDFKLTTHLSLAASASAVSTWVFYLFSLWNSDFYYCMPALFLSTHLLVFVIYQMTHHISASDISLRSSKKLKSCTLLQESHIKHTHTLTLLAHSLTKSAYTARTQVHVWHAEVCMSSITQLSQQRRKKRARTRTNTHSHTIWLSVLSIVQWPVVITLSTGPKPIALYTHAPRPGSVSWAAHLPAGIFLEILNESCESKAESW